ncbi:ABC transporter ATP-binding protein/permease [Olsenella massiliensis]|uniref:ABC transporter ATP-binding protein/permease n=1 Tax=Olsenella massiliensis TaxID=1622075 RepID=UPI00071DAA7E|nr:ABC transporter ATP-binding protein/permease [Olsenella massiliensis]
MLELRNVSKTYVTSAFSQVALDGVTVILRDSEFVAVLGPSGSGKTTMLNVLGGLDRPDAGDIVINGVSTAQYGPRDWDDFRNHRVGFVFQSYNLIPHQSVLSNVELALTLSGVGRAERRTRALRALGQVGLTDHARKRPHQLSGGQMQRVAIARALVNDPDIILADEPTGALDTETGLQVMEILAKVAQDRLVVMVTHNAGLAERYATRVIRIRDGSVVGDSDPIAAGVGRGAAGVAAGKAPDAVPDSRARDVAPARPASSGDGGPGRGRRGGRRASMGILTALSLSFNNLMSKGGRTALTAFAGSIGIMGIAAILALSNGVNDYIRTTERDTLSSYPLTVSRVGMDMSGLMGTMTGGSDSTQGASGGGKEADASGPIPQTALVGDLLAQVRSNDLAEFKRFLEGGTSDITRYASAVQYGYDVTPWVFEEDASHGVTQLNPSPLSGPSPRAGERLSLSITPFGSSSFSELASSRDLLESQMDVVRGRWPSADDEAVLILRPDGSISDYTLYNLGFYDLDAMSDLMRRRTGGEDVELPDDMRDFSYDDAMGMRFKVVPACALYQRNASSGTWTDMSDDADYLRAVVDEGITLKVVGVVRPTSAAGGSSMPEGVGYLPSLTSRLIKDSSESRIVQDQLAQPEVDVFTGRTFDDLQSEQGRTMDMSSLFSVDEDKLRSAFSFDASALQGLGRLDLSGISLGPSDPTGTFGPDLTGMSLDPSVTSSILDADALGRLVADAPRFDVDAALGQAAADLTDEQRDAIAHDTYVLGSGFIQWMRQNHPDEVLADPSISSDALSRRFQEYVSEDATAREVRDDLDALTETTLQTVVDDAMQAYLTRQFVPYFAQSMQSLMSVAAQAMTTQLALQLQQQMAQATDSLSTRLSQVISGQLQAQMSALSHALSDGFTVDPAVFASAIKLNMSQEDLASLFANYANADELTYRANLRKLGYADAADPDLIKIYPKDFPSKEGVLGVIDQYNQAARDAQDERRAIQYVDVAGTLMRSVTSIVDMVSLVLIAFVSISLVVSSIMIGIITYISVLERRKEIGILRAMGASRLNIANIFNAETTIEGLLSGVLAISVVYALSAPINAAVLQAQGVHGIMALRLADAVALVVVSVLLTLVAGVVPAMAAARRDPVEALRGE